MVCVTRINMDDHKRAYIHNAVRLSKYLIKDQIFFYFHVAKYPNLTYQSNEKR